MTADSRPRSRSSPTPTASSACPRCARYLCATSCRRNPTATLRRRRKNDSGPGNQAGSHMVSEHDKFMAIAIEEAKAGAAMGEQPFGAVVVIDGEVVVRSRSLKVSTSDTTAHSETLAIKLATQKLQRRVIPEATFYATCEPCPMCLGAIFNAGIK